VFIGANVLAQSAQLTDLTVRLIDLDPADGIVPAVSFSGPSSATASYGIGRSRSSDSEVGSQAFGEVSASSGGSAHLSGDVMNGEGLASVSAGALQPGYTFSNALLTLAGPQFSITPATEIVISGQATVTRDAYLALELSGTTSTGAQDDFFRVFSPNSLQTSAASISFSNTDPDYLTGNFTGWLGAVASFALPSAVPEPDAWLFLVAGLAIVLSHHAARRVRLK